MKLVPVSTCVIAAVNSYSLVLRYLLLLFLCFTLYVCVKLTLSNLWTNPAYERAPGRGLVYKSGTCYNRVDLLYTGRSVGAAADSGGAHTAS